MLYPTSSLFCLYGCYLYPSFMQDDLYRVLDLERLCCRMFTGCGHLSIETGFSPFLISRQIFLIIQGKMCQLSFRFSHQQLLIFCPVYLHFVHVWGNECFRYSHQAFNMSELGTENQLLFGSFFSTGFGIILASCLWGGKENSILGALLSLFQLQCSFPRNCFQTAPAQKSMCHILLLVKCSVLLSVLTVKDLSQSVISLLSTWMFCGILFLRS